MLVIHILSQYSTSNSKGIPFRLQINAKVYLLLIYPHSVYSDTAKKTFFLRRHLVVQMEAGECVVLFTSNT